MSTKKRVIIDLDVGSDDAFALLLLLHAEKIDLIKIEAIVSSMGNASLENTCKNVVRLLEILHRTDIPVYKGVIDAIIPSETYIPQFHGLDGLGDLEHKTQPDLSILQKEPASTAIKNIVLNNPREITFICLAPLTNLALTMKLYNDFAPNIKEIFIMGGNYAATGNITETAEYNFYVDPEAAYIVLNSAKCPITLATWETCLNMHIKLKWRWEVLGLCKTPFIHLLNKVERNIYTTSNHEEFWYPCDGLAAIAMLYPESILQQSKHNATLELHGSKTRGQIVLDHLKKKEPNIHVLEILNEEFVKNILIKAAQAFPQ